MNRAVILVEVIPDGNGFKFRRHLKIAPAFALKFNPDWPDVPPKYRGRIIVPAEFGDRSVGNLIGRTLHVDAWKFRVIERDYVSDSLLCVLESRWAFLAVWNARLHRQAFTLAVSCVRFMRRVGAMRKWGESTYANRIGFPWRDIYVLDLLLKRMGR